jgi:TP901 family phage tail tape measure protein
VSVVANVAINVDSRNAVTKLRQVQSQAQATEKAFGALQSAIGALGVGFALTKVIADVKELDTNLRRLGTVGGDVKALDKGLGSLSRNLDGIASKAELAAASYQALSAGFTDTASNLKVVEAATKAAVGGLVDVTGVVEVTTKTLNAYGMSADQAVKVTDSISKSIEFGQVQWSDYTSQLGRVASVAALAGVSLDEVNAFIAAATKNGATAEVAFTGLGSTLATILKPSKESADAAEALGINWTLAGIRGEGFESLMSKLAKAMKENPVLATEMVGGQEAIRGAFAAAAKGGQDYQMILEGLNGAAGKTEADFQTMKGSLENTLKALDTAFKNLSEALGKAFGPTIVIAIQDITKGVNGFADVMGGIPQPVMNAVGQLIKLIAQVLLLQKGIQVIIALRSGFVATMVAMGTATAASGTAAKVSAGSFAVYTNNIRALQTQTAATTPVLQGMLATLRTLAAIGTIAIVVNVAVTGMAAVYQAQAEIDRLRGRRSEGGAAAAFGGSATAEQKKAQQDALSAIQKERASSGFISQQAAAAAGIGKTMARQRADLLTERERSARAILALPTRGQAAPTIPTAPTVPTAGGGGDDKKKKGKTDAEREAEKAAKLEQQTQQRLRSLTRETELIGQITNLKVLQAAAEAVGDQELQARLAGEEQIVNIIQNTAQELDGVTDKRLEQAILGKAETEILQAQAGVQIELQRIEDERQKTLEEIVTGIAEETALVMAATPELRQKLELEQQIANWKKEGVITSEQEAAAIRAANTELERQKKIREEIAAQQQMLNDLYDGIAGQIAGGVGSAIDAVTGSVDNLGDALKDIGRDILAAVGKMLIFYAIAQALGALGGNDGVGIFSTLAKGFGFKGAKDGAFWPGGFQAFADGGLVTKPTMGLVGEGGEPEYIIPASKMSAAMKRYGGGTRGSAVIPTSGDTSEAGGNATQVNGAIDVRYTVERINSVEYVTADQFQRGMQQAAMQGAQQGEQRALRQLQQNTAVRGRVGLR